MTYQYTGTPGFDLAAVRDLLLAAFTAPDLRRLFLYTNNAKLRTLVQEFSPSDGLTVMVDRVIEFCATRGLLPDLLHEVERANPHQYARYAHQLQADHSTLQGDPLGFRLAAEATRIRLAYTHDPQFAASKDTFDYLVENLTAWGRCRAPADQVQELEHLLEQAEEAFAYEEKRDEIEATAQTLKVHRTEFEALLSNLPQAMEQAHRLFSEERFQPLRYTADQVNHAHGHISPLHIWWARNQASRRV